MNPTSTQLTGESQLKWKKKMAYTGKWEVEFNKTSGKKGNFEGFEAKKRACRKQGGILAL